MLTVAHRVGHHFIFSEVFFDLEDILLQLLKCFFFEAFRTLAEISWVSETNPKALDWYNLGPQWNSHRNSCKVHVFFKGGSTKGAFSVGHMELISVQIQWVFQLCKMWKAERAKRRSRATLKKGHLSSFLITLSGWWWLEYLDYFSIYWEYSNPNWRTPSFFRGVGIPPTSYGGVNAEVWRFGDILCDQACKISWTPMRNSSVYYSLLINVIALKKKNSFFGKTQISCHLTTKV